MEVHQSKRPSCKFASDRFRRSSKQSLVIGGNGLRPSGAFLTGLACVPSWPWQGIPFMTLNTAVSFNSFAELREFVFGTMCDREQFAPDAFPRTERVIKRGDAVCGYLFSIYGPRSVVCNAIFETNSNSIHFYSAGGERVLSIRVSRLPDLPMNVPWQPRVVG